MAPRVRARGRNIEKSLGKVTKEMDSFPVAAVTKYHPPGRLNSWNLFSQFGDSEKSKMKVSAGSLPG